jgi:starvation-inducible outer membrane lipoprotein
MWRRLGIGGTCGALGAILLCAVAGCSSVVPEALRGGVDRKVTYPDLARDPEALRGRLVLAGGEVLRVEPTGPDMELTLAERPLSALDESPVLSMASRGDLLVQVPGGARAAFREGQVITVVGVVVGGEAGGGPRGVPRLQAQHVQVWPTASGGFRPEGPGW